MTEKRFKVVTSDFTKNYVIHDSKNQYIFRGFKWQQDADKFCDVLNEQHDALIKKDELLSKVLSVNSNYEKCLKEIDDVLSKHNIHTLEKLDQVLTNERTW